MPTNLELEFSISEVRRLLQNFEFVGPLMAFFRVKGLVFHKVPELVDVAHNPFKCLDKGGMSLVIVAQRDGRTVNDHCLVDSRVLFVHAMFDAVLYLGKAGDQDVELDGFPLPETIEDLNGSQDWCWGVVLDGKALVTEERGD
jgi:hypothetical protein